MPRARRRFGGEVDRHCPITHPDVEGIGMYLVLWFGHGPMGDPFGMKPKTRLTCKSASAR